MSDGVCTACGRSIDAAAKLCPYCGADPATGERVDTQAIVQEIFHPRELTASETVLEYARQRQGVVIGVTIAVVFVLLAALHQFVTVRNANEVSDAPAMPLTEIADLAKMEYESAPAQLPPLDFQYEGQPQAMRTYIVERGAIAPQPAPAPAPPAQQPQTQRR
ncbi:MAG TPA: zinc ribbon domain-containing protein [Thermoanaerobaculia bacterium]|nr:zinc ribbon domain-containing protein [Thermoanaerobaculia bacterium]